MVEGRRLTLGERVPLQGAIVGCHRVPLCAMVGGKEGDDQLCEVDVGPLPGAIAGCHSSVLWLGGDDQLWWSGWCRVPL